RLTAVNHMRGSRGRARRGRGLYQGGICAAPHKNTFEYATIHGMGWNVDSPPNSRSIETIGTSPSLSPSSWARMDISKAQDQPLPMPVDFNLGKTPRRNIFMPVVESLSAVAEQSGNTVLPVSERRCPSHEPP